jgi:hypothetical protein
MMNSVTTLEIGYVFKRYICRRRLLHHEWLGLTKHIILTRGFGGGTINSGVGGCSNGFGGHFIQG